MGAGAALALLAALSVGRSAARPGRLVVARAALLPAGDHRLGPLPRATTLRGAVVLEPRDEAGLRRFVATVSDHRSPRYGDYLPRGAFAARFGPTATTRAAVADALRAAGLHVSDHADGDGLLVRFQGTAGAAERAFATTIGGVALPDGERGRATTTPVTLPRPVADSVAAVVGLDETVVAHRIGVPPDTRGHRHHETAHDDATTTTTPANAPHACPAAQRAAQRYDGLTDDAIAHAYGADGLYEAGDTGAGQAIAVYELEPFLRADVKTFDHCYFGAARAARMLSRLNVVDIDGGPPHGTGSGEASLDVEDISALAPGARVDVYVGPSANAYDSLDGYAAIVDADRDRVVSTSWGLCEQGVQRGQPGFQEAENLLFEQAAAQGQTVFAAAGDQGSDDCNATRSPTPSAGQNPVSVDDPGSQPYVVSVGGTAIDDASGPRPLEHAWNDGAAYGAGGGGISMSWSMPAWQRSARLPGIARPGGAAYGAADRVEGETGYFGGFCDNYGRRAPGTPCRLVPDVSAQADEFTGSITVYSRAYRTAHTKTGWTTTGGTSSAAPIWAASLALVNASAGCRADARTRDGVGFVAPLLYALASVPSRYAASFNDVRTGNNDVYGLDNGRIFAAGRGYDLATGLGSPRLSGPGGTAGLAAEACAAAAPRSRPEVTALAPDTAPTSGQTTLTVHGSGFAVRGHSNVHSVQIGSLQVPAARVRVRGPHTLRLTLPPARRAVPPLSTTAQDGAGPALVLVTLRDGATSAAGPRAVLHYLDERRRRRPSPTVGAVSPTGGLASHPRRVTILGTGFEHVTAVRFGGVRARRFRVASPDRIAVVPPPRTAATRCVALPRHGAYAHETAADDICQVHVQVQTAGGVDAASRIRPAYEGQQVTDSEGDVVVPLDREAAPAPDEYDYAPRPHITSVSTTHGPLSLADAHGGTVITVHGSGLNLLTLDNADFGDPTRYSSQATRYAFVSGTTLQIHAPARAITAGRHRVAFSVRTLGGRSNPLGVTYAGVPAITRVVNAHNARNLDGVYGGPDTGGTALVVHGRGMRGQLLGVEFLDRSRTPRSVGTQYTIHVRGDDRLTTQTVAENPAVIAVEPCTVTGCTQPGAHNLFWLYAPGDPRVTAVMPASGPAAGGTAVQIDGANLGCPLSASFGATAAAALTPVKTLLSCGSTQTLGATSPAGAAGTTVPVTVQTAEGFYTGARPRTSAGFSYR